MAERPSSGMGSEDWLARWENGRTGWHEVDGNAGLQSHWHVDTGSVLVPLCGKSPDLLWLARRGHEVVGIELAEKAIHEFFAEQDLNYFNVQGEAMLTFRAESLPLTLVCGDYFQYAGGPFDALYDRGSIVAVDPAIRPDYVRQTKALLKPHASLLVITLEYDQEVVSGPPFSLLPDELSDYWQALERVEVTDDIDNCPPKFRAAGLTNIAEVVWRSPG